MSQTRTATATYTVVDIENVVRRLKADLVMIADSTGAWTAAKAADYAHDVEVLATELLPRLLALLGPQDRGRRSGRLLLGHRAAPHTSVVATVPPPVRRRLP